MRVLRLEIANILQCGLKQTASGLRPLGILASYKQARMACKSVLLTDTWIPCVAVAVLALQVTRGTRRLQRSKATSPAPEVLPTEDYQATDLPTTAQAEQRSQPGASSSSPSSFLRHHSRDSSGRLLLKNLGFEELEQWCLADGNALAAIATFFA